MKEISFPENRTIGREKNKNFIYSNAYSQGSFFFLFILVAIVLLQQRSSQKAVDVTKTNNLELADKLS